MSAEEELRNDYINDLVDTGNLDPEQIHITSVDLLNSVTGQYKITSEIEFFDLDENAVQALVTKINDKSAFTRLKEKHGSIESVPQSTKKQFSESDPKPKMIATKKKPDGTIVEKVETIRRKTGSVRERKFNPNDETDILETTEISAEDENGDKIRETFFKDQRRRRVRFKANNESNVLETTEVSSPDETTGDVTTKVTQADGSYVETVKDSSDVVKNTTEASAPDTTTGNVTITVTDNATGETTNNVVYGDGPLVVDRSIHFDDYTIDDTVIGNNGISVSEQTYTTTGVGKVGIDDNGKKYLEMLHGQLQLPAYVDDPTAIAHTMYFVVRSTSFNDVIGYIQKVATGTDNNFNLHVTQNIGLFPIVWPTNNNWVVTKDNSFNPRDSYIIILLKFKYKGQYTYDARMQFVSKPFDEIVYGGYTSEMTDLSSSSMEISTQINIGTNDSQTTNMHLYEYGLLNEYVNDTKFDSILQIIVDKYFPEPEPEVKAFEDLFGTGWTIVEYLPGNTGHWFPGSGNLEGYSGGEFLFTTGDNSRWLIADHEQVNGTYDGESRTIKKSSINSNSYTAIWYHRSGNTEDPWISLTDHSTSVTNEQLMYAENSFDETQRNKSIHSSGMYVYTRGGTVNKQYTYKFQVNVQHIHGPHNIIRHIMANGEDFRTWDKFVSLRAITPPDRGAGSHINDILTAGTETAWNSPTISVGKEIFELVTSERVKYFDIEYRRPKYRSGWKIFENGTLKINETTNGGNGADSPTLYYPYMVNPEFGRVGRKNIFSPTEQVYPPTSIATYESWVAPSAETGFYTTSLSGSYMDGTYKVWASHVHDFPSTERSPAHAFDHRHSGSVWVAGSAYTNGEGSEFIAISLPYGIKLSKYTVKSRSMDFDQMAKSWDFEGSNDGIVWVKLDTRTNETAWTEFEVREYAVFSTDAYKMYRLNVFQTNGSVNLTINGFKLYGYQLTSPPILQTTLYELDQPQQFGGNTSIYSPYFDIPETFVSWTITVRFKVDASARCSVFAIETDDGAHGFQYYNPDTSTTNPWHLTTWPWQGDGAIRLFYVQNSSTFALNPSNNTYGTYTLKYTQSTNMLEFLYNDSSNYVTANPGYSMPGLNGNTFSGSILANGLANKRVRMTVGYGKNQGTSAATQVYIERTDFVLEHQ